MSPRYVSAAAALIALGAGQAHAQSELRLYGLMDLGVEVAKGASGSEKRFIPGGLQGSRWGAVGSEDLGGGLRANFRLEAGFTADDGLSAQGGRAFGRESSVGLSSPTLGGLNLGRLPVPYYTVEILVDAFAWGGNGGLPALTRTQPGAVRQVLPVAVNGRDDNAIGWVSPNWGGITLRAHHAFSENSPTLGSSDGLSARYTSSAAELVAGWHRQKSGSAGTGDIKAEVLGGSYNFGVARVYAGYTREQNSCSNCTGAYARIAGASEADFRIINLGTRVPVGATALIFQVARIQDRSDYSRPQGDRDSTWLAVGAEHYLSKRTTLYASLGTVTNRNGSNYALGTGTSQQPATLPVDPSRSTTFSAGMRHTF